MWLDGKRVLVTGGTGSFGQVVVNRLLSGEMGQPENITVFSRDEAKQHYMRLSYINREAATDEIIYRNFQQMLRFSIGDMRDYNAVLQAVRHAEVVIHAAALKQVPTCEYFPEQAIMTNIGGAQNLVRAIRSHDTPVETVVALSTDKACGPINVYGMTKAIMERVIIEGNMDSDTRFVGVRYGNVIASRGSVIPLFLNQIENGGPVTITHKDMTRFWLELDHAVDIVFESIRSAKRGEVYVPRVPASRIVDLAEVLMGGREVPIVYTGIRPGEKIHEILVSEEESNRTIERNGFYVIQPILPELLDEGGEPATPVLDGAYTSAEVTLDHEALGTMMAKYVDAYAVEGLK
ncbi:MAG: polysaccharide biosynthesis protein [Chloroflexi bacterium]|nr:polysaccharide biosynthesis protein [Chloroflexota bacterium]